MKYCISEHTVQHFLNIRNQKLKEFNEMVASPSIQYSTFWMSDSQSSSNSMKYCISEHTVQHFLKARCPKLKEFNGILHLRTYSTALIEGPRPKTQGIQWNIASPSLQYNDFQRFLSEFIYKTTIFIVLACFCARNLR